MGYGKTEENSNKEKKYVLDMFPYPSWDGLHMWHMENYTATDIYSRFLRMKWYNVLHPMWWDAFGLPAENYAIKTGVHPNIQTHENVGTYTRQIKTQGFAYDWSREIDTSSPEYYKWTQWFFLFLYKNWLAYKKKAKVNWCGNCQTVLANEQAEWGLCDRCGNEVIQKDLEQWFFKITDFAEDLINDINALDWPESTKTAQKNWIGKSEGVEFDVELQRIDQRIPENKNINNSLAFCRVYTTRVDTVFGMTYVVISPESPLVKELKNNIQNWEEVERYSQDSAKKTELERTELNKDKTGVELKWIVWINPFNWKEVKIFVWDYVLGNYWTWAVMAVPAHDERDYEFAKKYDLEIIQSIVPSNLDVLNYLKLLKIAEQVFEISNKSWINVYLCWWITIPFNTGVVYRQNADLDYAVKKDKAEEFVNILKENSFVFKNNKSTPDWRNVTVLEKNGIEVELIEDMWLIKYSDWEELNFWNSNADDNTKTLWWYKAKTINFEFYQKLAKKSLEFNKQPKRLIDVEMFKKWAYTEDWILINSGEFDWLRSAEAREKMAQWVEEKGIGKKKINYRLRDWLVSRQRYWWAPIPIIYCDNCVKVKEKVLIQHGRDSDTKSWFLPSLKANLESKWYEVFTHDIPDPKNPDFDRWYSLLSKFIKENNLENCHLIGHSMWGHLSLKMAENFKFKSLTLVAPLWFDLSDEYFNQYINILTREELDTLKKYQNIPLDPSKVQENASKITFVFWLKDRWVTEEIRDFYKMNFGQVADIHILEEYGHMSNYECVDRVEFIENLFDESKPWVFMVPEKDLPVELPTDVDFKPTWESPLVFSKSFHDIKCPQCGGNARRESDTMDTFVCSSWYYLRFADPHNMDVFASAENIKKWLPVDMYMGWAEHTVLHLLYARFFTKALHKYWFVDFKEPFLKLRHQWMILAEDWRKMSKSLGNVVNPDTVVSEFWADATRLFVMFMWALMDAKPWNSKNIIWTKRFLDKVWNLQWKISNSVVTKDELEILKNKTIKKVSEDLEVFGLNTAIAQLMIFTNALEKEALISKNDYETLIVLLSPFAPHITEELWQIIGNSWSIHNQIWPTFDPNKLLDSTVKIAIQVNWKVRDEIEVLLDTAEDEIKELAVNCNNVKKYLEWAEIKKIIYVKNKLVSIVVN